MLSTQYLMGSQLLIADLSTELWAGFGQMITIILGFMIFYWVMKTYAWGPILDTIDERQRIIQNDLSEAQRMRTESEQTAKDYEASLKDIAEESRQKLQEAVDEGQRVANEITEKARKEAQEITDEARRKIEEEMTSARKDMRNEIVSLTIAITERLIDEKLDADKDKELVNSYIKDLEGAQ